ncbi:exodeoxyribonuclease VII large subunit [Sinomonas sp. JGH33]|uniref:Exodeoxyribonuclease 7 large subunit n=1 Tax=Sinomonas terricola TaxID=3110330 RepID=A0ABU5T0Y8_9MICC|nr:exodeoxyribonuclease VII large subunit [Sinomonas sp. JGH33]MEA5453245.1 exodeoxyribonuclease VII large subunit [Sinomonas sp. JGH33]
MPESAEPVDNGLGGYGAAEEVGETAADAADGARASVPERAAETTPDNPWPLALLSRKLKEHIDRSPQVWIEGQVIELNRRGSNAFLTLRDIEDEISLSASAWGQVLDRLKEPLERGSRVVALVKPEMWLKTGRLNMQVRNIRPVGLGDLLARIERLRHSLGAEGLFAEARKKRLPLLPHSIGLITGRDSDAKKDVLRNAALRWPAVHFEIREVAVQGPSAVSEVTRALRELDARPEVDVIVIARGGGSLEDLLPFSDERLVRAVADAATPVVSAIGHEADRPILDDVADLRASTPTDAAKRIVPDVTDELARVHHCRERLERQIALLVGRETQQLALLRSRPVLAQPGQMLTARHEDLERLLARAHHAVNAAIVRGEDAVSHLRAQIRALSPQQTLDRGYAVVQHLDGPAAAVVRSPEDAPAGTELRVRLARGALAARSEGPLEQHRAETRSATRSTSGEQEGKSHG